MQCDGLCYWHCSLTRLSPVSQRTHRLPYARFAHASLAWLQVAIVYAAQQSSCTVSALPQSAHVLPCYLRKETSKGRRMCRPEPAHRGRALSPRMWGAAGKHDRAPAAATPDKAECSRVAHTTRAVPAVAAAPPLPPWIRSACMHCVRNLWSTRTRASCAGWRSTWQCRAQSRQQRL